MAELIAVPGQNCWRRVHAERLAFLVDGDSYFSALKDALLQARHAVTLLGWEFDSRTRLDRDRDDTTIGGLLRAITRERPRLEVNLLVWDSALLYSFDREFLPVVKHDWLTHERLRFRLDDAHPIGASHHQKVVVIDDRVAFLGGMDISSRRWDTTAHRLDDPRRSDPGFPLYPPFHDVQAVLSGPAAAALGELARLRWRNATGRRLTPPPNDPAHDPWPRFLAPDLTDIPVGLSRTLPPWEGEAAVREVERLTLDIIAAARRSLYIENQYFAARCVGDALTQRLTQDDAPEIAVVTSGFSAGFLERTVMGAGRSRLQWQLRTIDRHDRLRLFAPMIEDHPLKVHAKVMVMDDRLLRIGSANLNNRSMGLDTECDLIVEDGGDGRVAAVIAGFRHRLLAEHLGSTPPAVAEAEAAAGLFGCIAALGGPARRLQPLEPGIATEAAPEAELLDPEGPLETLLVAAAGGGPRRSVLGRFAIGMWLLALLALGAVAWHAWPHSPRLAGLDRLVGSLELFRAHPLSPLLVAGLFLLAGLSGLPVFLLVVATAALFGGWLGGLYAFAGCLASAGFAYSVGKALGRDRVRRLTRRRATRVSRALVRHGVLAVAMLRLVPVTSFTAINLMAGAAGLGWRDFLAGSALGLSPMVVALSAFGEVFAAVLRRAEPADTLWLTVLTLLLAIVGASVLSRLRRFVAPPVEPGAWWRHWLQAARGGFR